MRILPGDAVMMQLDQATAPTPEALARARQELGLDRPFLDQYGSWMAGVVQGDLGRSLVTRRPVTQEPEPARATKKRRAGARTTVTRRNRAVLGASAAAVRYASWLLPWLR